MLRSHRIFALVGLAYGSVLAGELPLAFPSEPQQGLERTCFQTGQGWSSPGNLRSNVAIVYGIDPGLPNRIATWREQGYRIQVMTGVSWGSYQDYLYGRFDGVNHGDEAQTDRYGKKISHGGDVYYMCPGANYGKLLCVGLQRALAAGAEAIHLEEPEFWVRGGYSEGFKREWRSYYGEDWQTPHERPAHEPFYGLALPLLKHGMPVTPVQLENVVVPHYLDDFKVLLLSYHGQKPQSPQVHAPLANWVKSGGPWS